MKTHLLRTLAILGFVSTLNLSISTVLAQATAFTYQGRLNDGSNPATGNYDLRFAIYGAATGPAQIGSAVTNAATPVSSGLFTVTLDFGAGVFTGDARWLEIGVRASGSGAFTTLGPRQPLTPTPHAVYAQTAGTASSASTLSSGLYAASVNFNHPSNLFSGTFYGQTYGSLYGSVFGNLFGNAYGDGNGLYNLNAANLGAGTVPEGRLAANVARTNQVWLLGGNAGTAPGSQFLGTTDNRALELKVNGLRGLRLEPDADAISPNLLVGTGGNVISTSGSMIAGGDYNVIERDASYSTVINGFYNVIRTNALYSFIGNGFSNTIQSNAQVSVIGGGIRNTILADAQESFIGGGYQNTNGGPFAVVPGGFRNAALGTNSFAAGQRAKAVHSGAFVWADAQGADFASTAPNQFLVRASSGLGINTNNPAGAGLSVAGIVRATTFQGDASGLYNVNVASLNSSLGGDGSGLTNLNASQLTAGTVPDARLAANVARTNQVWLQGGNAGTTAGVNSLGTTDNQALEIKVNGQRALRLEPNATSPNLVGGYSGNIVSNGLLGATIVGGGGWLGTRNRAGGQYATVVGGTDNTASDFAATAMGWSTTASGSAATSLGANTIASGRSSLALGELTVAGGVASVALGSQSTIPAGVWYSFAGGRQAQAVHSGTFVWADWTSENFASSGENQFLIRAHGGVGINKTNPATALDVNGTVTATGLNSTGPLRLNNQPTYLRDGSDQNHGLSWFASNTFAGSNPDGPVLYGCGGGALGTACGSQAIALSWTSSGVTVFGTFNNNSDRNAKRDFAPVSPGEILEKVAQLPVSEWSYQTDATTRHIGPMAQDFHATFKVGTDEKHIAPIDEGGVALAAIQGLNQKVEERSQRSEEKTQRTEDSIRRLEAENTELKQRLTALEGLVNQLSTRGN